MNPDLNSEENKNIDVKFSEGTFYQIGSVLWWKALSFSLEYQRISDDKTVMQEIGILSPGTTLSDVELRNRS
jgi:hypothetical protein